jgi:hypothetical protein
MKSSKSIIILIFGERDKVYSNYYKGNYLFITYHKVLNVSFRSHNFYVQDIIKVYLSEF